MKNPDVRIQNPQPGRRDREPVNTPQKKRQPPQR